MSHSRICLGESACRSSLTNKVWTIERDLCIQYLFVSFPDQSLEWFHYLLPIHLQKCFPGYWMSIKSYFPSYRELTNLIKRKYNRASYHLLCTLLPIRLLSTQLVKHLHPPGIWSWNFFPSLETLREVSERCDGFAECLFQKSVLCRRNKWTTPERGVIYFTTVPKIWEG